MDKTETIRAAIKGKLQALNHIKQVWDYEPDDLAGKFPAIALTLRDYSDTKFADNQRNVRSYNFTAKFYIERGGKHGFSPEKAERVMVELLDEFVTAMDMDTTLSGICQYAKVTKGRAGYEGRELNMRVAEMDVECVAVTDAK